MGDARRLGLVGFGLSGLLRLVAAGRRQRQVGIGVGDGLPLVLDVGVEGHLDVVVQQRFEDHEGSRHPSWCRGMVISTSTVPEDSSGMNRWLTMTTLSSTSHGAFSSCP